MIQFEQYHAGFGDEGYLYCDRGPTVLTWSAYDRAYSALANKLPWMLTDAEKRHVEDALLPCPCGGKFAFGNPPLCPYCLQEIRSLVPDPIYYLVVDNRVRGEDVIIWSPEVARRDSGHFAGSSELDEIRAWFAEKGFGVRFAQNENGSVSADLTKLRSSQVSAPMYGGGDTELEAARRAKQRYLQEQ